VTDLARLREFYAEELRAVSNLHSPLLVRAFASVPREHFLGPGPWEILAPAEPRRIAYRTTEDADPKHLYHNVLVAIDTSRHLHNGQPSALAQWIDSLDLQEGERIVHIGCGVGYYTAILAEVVGSAGHVMAIELDPDLAACARKNLRHLAHVEVVEGDGGTYDVGPADTIFVNAGATHPRQLWLDSLRAGGRLLVPLTVAINTLGHGGGGMLKVTRHPRGFSARFISEVRIFPCIGARDAEMNEKLREALRGGAWQAVESLRRDPHEPTGTCWLHGRAFCLSTLVLAEDTAPVPSPPAGSETVAGLTALTERRP
jgi:protein-L-isoaspartate(D-aspartate) O-methyltransferase